MISPFISANAEFIADWIHGWKLPICSDKLNTSTSSGIIFNCFAHFFKSSSKWGENYQKPIFLYLLFINLNSIKMKDILVVAKLKEGKFEKFMGFMKSEQGMNERRKIADLTKTLGTVSPDKSAVMFKISVHDENALNSFLDGSNPVSKPIFDEVMVSYEIFELNKV